MVFASGQEGFREYLEEALEKSFSRGLLGNIRETSKQGRTCTSAHHAPILTTNILLRILDVDYWY